MKKEFTINRLASQFDFPQNPVVRFLCHHVYTSSANQISILPHNDTGCRTWTSYSKFLRLNTIKCPEESVESTADHVTCVPPEESAATSWRALKGARAVSTIIFNVRKTEYERSPGQNRKDFLVTSQAPCPSVLCRISWWTSIPPNR